MSSKMLTIIASVLGAAFLIALVLCGLFVLFDKDIPDLFGTLVTAILTGLLGLLVPHPSGDANE